MAEQIFSPSKWKPPDNPKNPYQAVAPLKQVLEIDPQKPTIARGTFEQRETENPYVDYQTYQQQSGVRISGNYGNFHLLESGKIRKDKKMLPSKIIGKRFAIYRDGIYLKADEDDKKLCNFYVEIVDIRILRNRDGTTSGEIVYIVGGTDLSHRLDEFNEKNLPTIPEENFSKIISEILRRFPECYINPELKHIAPDYLKEYVATKYRDFRQNHPPNEFFAYSGWEFVNGKHVYLSDSRSDCRCGITVPKILPEEILTIWREDLEILNVQKKIYNPDGTLNEINSLNVILLFWLYIHLGYACNLFMDAGLKVQFILLLIGKTGSLKTSICETFAEPFNEGSMLRFESTAVALENYREECIDQNMIVDDIFKKDLDSMKKMEALNRAFGDGIGRAKSTGKDYKEISRSKVRGGCIVTAEHDLNSQQSSALRYVTVKIESDSIDSSELKKFQDDKILSKLQNRYSKVQKIFGGWIDYLERNYLEIVSWLINFQAPPLSLKFKRHQQIYRVLCATAQMIIGWGIESGAVNEQQAQKIFEMWYKVIVDFMIKNQIAATVAEPYQQFLITLQQAIATGSAQIATDREKFEKNGGRYIGFRRIDKGDSEYVLVPDKVFSLVKHQLIDSGKDLVSDATPIFKELFEHGISKGYENQSNKNGTRTRYLKRVKLNDHQPEVLVISVSAMEKCIEDFFKEG